MFELRIITLCTLKENLKASVKHKCEQPPGKKINSVISVSKISISSVVLYLNIFLEKHSEMNCKLKFTKRHEVSIKWSKYHLTTYD